MKSPEQLHQTFAASEYGKTLNNAVRFADFKPVDISNQTWVDVIGDDVNNLRHMPHTHRLAARFALKQTLSEDDTNILRVTAMTHDWGEAIDGDIPLPLKTKQDEVSEQKSYRLIAEDLLGKYEGEELSDTVWRVLDKEDKELGNAFCAIEYIGYNTTAMRAGYMGKLIAARLINLPFDRPTTEHLAGGLIGFESSMQSQSFATLADYVKKYPGISEILHEGVPGKQEDVMPLAKIKEPKDEFSY